jgi:hypothetical protein
MLLLIMLRSCSHQVYVSICSLRAAACSLLTELQRSVACPGIPSSSAEWSPQRGCSRKAQLQGKATEVAAATHAVMVRGSMVLNAGKQYGSRVQQQQHGMLVLWQACYCWYCSRYNVLSAMFKAPTSGSQPPVFVICLASMTAVQAQHVPPPPYAAQQCCTEHAAHSA